MARIRGRQVFKIYVDSLDVKKEFLKFSNLLVMDIKNSLEAKGTTQVVSRKITSRLQHRYGGSSPRLRSISASVKKANVVKSLKSLKSTKGQKSEVTSYKLISRLKQPKNIFIGVAHIPTLDEETNIAKLDLNYRPKHKAKFNEPPDPPKTIGSPSSLRHALWSILEKRNKTSYTISPVTSKMLAYTRESDGYSKWHRSSRVTWRISPTSSAKAYYLLNEQRQIYKEDREIFIKHISNSVKKFIETKTRFRK